MGSSLLYEGAAFKIHQKKSEGVNPNTLFAVSENKSQVVDQLDNKSSSTTQAATWIRSEFPS